MKNRLHLIKIRSLYKLNELVATTVRLHALYLESTFNDIPFRLSDGVVS